MSREAFGTNNRTGGGGPRFKNFRPKNEKSVSGRIFPSMHSLRARPNGWKCWHSTHFGYGIVDRTGKERMRTFECVERKNFQTKMVEVSCPECRLIERKKQELADRQKVLSDGLKKKGMLDANLVNAEILRDPDCAALTAWLKSHNLSGRFFVNFQEMETGEFGVLDIAGRHMKVLEMKINEAKSKYGIDAFSLDEGCYFTFAVVGKGGDVNHVVEIVTEPTEQRGGVRAKIARLTEAQIEEAVSVLPDLAEGVVRKITRDQVQLIVESDGDPSVVDAVMASGSGTVSLPPPQEEYGGEDETAAPPPADKPQGITAPASQSGAPQKTQEPPPQKVESPAAQVDQGESVLDLQRQLAELQAKLAASSAQAATPPQSNDPTPKKVPYKVPEAFNPNIAPEDFAKQFAPRK